MAHAPTARVLAALVTTVTLGLGTALVGASPAAASGLDLRNPLTRERVQRGDVDQDQWHIEHVYEVQIRLRRLGFLDAAPNGTFGPQTERAVKRFQRARHLKVTGIVNAATWKPLIVRSTFGLASLPARCKRTGWHMCYDRKRHQASLFHNGALYNSWLVRGGSSSAQTRVGDFTVQWRDEDHKSGQFDGAPMPYAQFFDGGQALHGSRYMMDPYVGHSHGCVNFYVEDARQLWNLTSTRKLFVHVYGAWS
jgi:hypothetical protein